MMRVVTALKGYVSPHSIGYSGSTPDVRPHAGLAACGLHLK